MTGISEVTEALMVSGFNVVWMAAQKLMAGLSSLIMAATTLSYASSK